MSHGVPEEPIDVTVILPAYNEQDSICGIYDQVVTVMEGSGYGFEILFVDDGSTDFTWPKIVELAERDSRVRALRHRRNFGKASALANGFQYARGEIIVTSDADMQYDPNDMLRLIEKIEEGYDVVSAYKVLRRDPLSKRIPSKFFNFFVRTTTGVQLHDMNAGLKAFRYQPAQALVRFGYGELHRFFIVIAARRGYCVTEVPVESLYRTTGRSKYGFERYLRGAMDFLTVFFLSGYAERPLHLLGGLGVTISGFGTLLFVYLGVVRLATGRVAAGSTLVIVAALLVLTGVQLLVAGLIAEMINNLERPNSGKAKIAQVLHVNRRSPVVLAPGVQVDRRDAAAHQRWLDLQATHSADARGRAVSGEGRSPEPITTPTAEPDPSADAQPAGQAH
jgi:glycosyltransferase involved in cell wall biosynthesis